PTAAPTAAPPPLPSRPQEDEATLSLDEWDQEQGGYRLAQVQLQLEDAPGGALSNYQRLVEANAREIRAVRRRFAALRQEDRWVTGLPDGPEVDLDRAIRALSDLAAGQQPKEDLYRRFVRHPQDLCALVLVDMSGSTQGHVLHLEQEALVLLAEGVSALGLPHAFYGFSGVSPAVGRLLRLKGFEERYDDVVKRRLGNLRAGGATRMGAYIRGAARLLARQPQPRRLLLMLSDGRPEDQDRYRGAYGVADSAMAVREASRLGVRCFCVGLDDDEQADTWLRPIFGPGRSLRLARVEQLPARLPEVFRGLL
ncbi:MAG: VWA domain-containing protein, partial [Alphaproteobacteria bacterium]|nr:VWA domain-containing protein [Alphaproteobacteria bacterium]